MRRSRPRLSRDVHQCTAGRQNGPAADLVPYCGVTPGPDPVSEDWHTGHDRNLLLEYAAAGQVCCMECLSPAALGHDQVRVVEPDRLPPGVDEFDEQEPVWTDDRSDDGPF